MLFECIVRPLQIESERAVALNACHPDECGSNKKPSKWCQIVVVSTLAYGLVPDHWAMPELLWLIPDDLAMSYMFYYWSLHMCDIWTYHVLVSKWKSLQRLTMRGCLRHWLSLLTVLSERSPFCQKLECVSVTCRGSVLWFPAVLWHCSLGEVTGMASSMWKTRTSYPQLFLLECGERKLRRNWLENGH